MTKHLMICVLATVLGSIVFAGDEDQLGQGRHRPGPEMNAELKVAFDQCHTSLNIAKPDENSDARPTREQMHQLKACVEAQGFDFPSRPEHQSDFGDQQDRPAKKNKAQRDSTAQ